jgi:pyrroline-5-carboxylate reductase
MSSDLTKHNIGFVGAGNIASAMINALVKHQLVDPCNVFASDTDCSKLSKLKDETGINILSNNLSVVEKTTIILLTIKPNVYATVLEEISDFLSNDHILISVAAGISTDFIKEKTRNRCKIVRTMPNIACLVEEGMTAISTNHDLNDNELIYIKYILSAFGKIEEVNEEHMDIVTAISGSSPAFIFMLIEAMADSAVMLGIPRNQAYRLVAQTVLGSAKLLMESNRHPGELKDIVCTPGGTTIQGIHSLESNGFRGTIMDAIRATALRSKELTRENS